MKIYIKIILIFLLFLNINNIFGQQIPRIGTMMVNGQYDDAFKVHSIFIQSEEGKDLIINVYAEAGMWLILPEIKLGKYALDAVKVVRLYVNSSKLSSAAIKLYKLEGLTFKLLEGGKNHGFIHILQRHAGKFKSVKGKGSLFFKSEPEYILDLMSKFVKSSPKLVKTVNTKKRVLLVYKSTIEYQNYIMVIDKTNKRINTFYPEIIRFK